MIEKYILAIAGFGIFFLALAKSNETKAGAMAEAAEQVGKPTVHPHPYPPPQDKIKDPLEGGKL